MITKILSENVENLRKKEENLLIFFLKKLEKLLKN